MVKFEIHRHGTFISWQTLYFWLRFLIKVKANGWFRVTYKIIVESSPLFGKILKMKINFVSRTLFPVQVDKEKLVSLIVSTFKMVKKGTK